MAMRPTDFGGARPIDGYGPGFFRVGGEVHRAPLLVTEAGVLPWAGLDDSAALLALPGGGADLLLVGTGPQMARLPEPLLDALDAAGLRVEAMASATAARAYNVMLSEGRRVAAALLPV